MSKVIRSVKNVTKGYSSVQVKVREATSNDPWGPTGTQMSEIAQLTFNSCVSHSFARFWACS
jgi:epsin